MVQEKIGKPPLFIATLICDPTEPVLTVGNVLPYHKHLRGGEFRWLADSVACEFPIPERPKDERRIWQSLQDRGVDLVIQKAEGRQKQMLLADMDSTMIKQECIDELGIEAGVGEQVMAITKRAMNGEMGFGQSLQERVALMAGLSADMIDHVLKTRITLLPGGAAVVATMKAAGAYTALVSGGFTNFTNSVARDLGFDENRANVLEIENGVLTGRVIPPILARQSKVDALIEITTRLGLVPDQVLAVGDGANDLGMLELAGTGVALHAKPAVAAQCDIRVNFGDLTALLYIQGFGQAEILNR